MEFFTLLIEFVISWGISQLAELNLSAVPLGALVASVFDANTPIGGHYSVDLFKLLTDMHQLIVKIIESVTQYS